MKGKIQAQILKFPTQLEFTYSKVEHVGPGRPRRRFKNINGLPGLRCAKCKEVKTLDKFYLRKGPVRYYSSYCKKCHIRTALTRYRRLK